MYGNEFCFVKGHTSSGDGGGGLFMWSTMPPHYGSGRYTADNNGTVVKTRSNTLDVGRWVRQYDGYLNVLYFGAFGKTQDYTIPIQNAINFAWLNAQNDPDMKESVVYIPNENYRINTLKIKSGISIIGEYRSHLSADNREPYSRLHDGDGDRTDIYTYGKSVSAW